MPNLHPVIDLQSLTIVPWYVCRTANCAGCYQKRDEGYGESLADSLDLDLLIPFLRNYASTVRVHAFGLIGGEITEYPDSRKLVRMLTDEFPGIRLEIVSNGQNHEVVGDLIDAANRRRNLVFEFSIDGYGDACDRLRGKNGYFSEVLSSIDEMKARGLGTNIHINTRYFHGSEDSIVEMAEFLCHRYGITRADISLIDVDYVGADPKRGREYVGRLRQFSSDFWGDVCRQELPRSHPLHQPYDVRRRQSFSVPGIHPDGYLYTCFDYNRGTRLGHIRSDDVAGMIGKMLNLAALNPEQCDQCLVGSCVKHHYDFHDRSCDEQEGS